MSKKVIKLSERADHDTRHVTVKQLLENAARFYKENPSYDKAVVIFVNTHEDRFDTAWMKANLLNSQTIAACQMTIQECIRFLQGEELS